MSIIQTKTVSQGNGKTFTANIEIFESTMELVEKCKTRKITDSHFDDKSRSSDYRKSWHGVGSYREALDLMNDGWNEKVNELQAAIGKIKATQSDKRICFQNDVHGFAPIVPLAILGVPNSMINSTYRPIKSKVISVYYDMTMSCGNDADVIVSNGRKVIEAIVKLENSGYRVNLFAVQAYNDSRSGDVVAVKVKSANQPLDMKRLCFPIMHAAFFRVIGFDWYSKFPKGKYRHGYGVNMVDCIGETAAHATMKNLFGKEAVYIMGRSVKSHDTGYIVDTIKGGDDK